jgi:FMN-dependent NADH-azoreductase
MEQWLRKNPGGTVLTRDVTTTPIAPPDAQWVTAIRTSADARTAEQKQLLKLSDELVGELKRADEYVIGAPMHNFSIPSSLKLWIDQICRAGETFAYIDGRPQGLLKGKKATILMASGGLYDEGTATASLNHVEPYLKSVLGFLGVTDTKFLSAGGSKAIAMGQVDAETFLQPHFDSIQAHLASAA